MDAIVEVETATVVTRVSKIMVLAVVNYVENVVTAVINAVSASTVRLSRGGVSLSAVSPDFINRKELALAGA